MMSAFEPTFQFFSVSAFELLNKALPSRLSSLNKNGD